MMYRVDFAKKDEPYWWLTDSEGFKHRFFISIYKVFDEDNSASFIGIIIGRLHLRFVKVIKKVD